MLGLRIPGAGRRGRGLAGEEPASAPAREPPSTDSHSPTSRARSPLGKRSPQVIQRNSVLVATGRSCLDRGSSFAAFPRYRPSPARISCVTRRHHHTSTIVSVRTTAVLCASAARDGRMNRVVTHRLRLAVSMSADPHPTVVPVLLGIPTPREKKRRGPGGRAPSTGDWESDPRDGDGDEAAHVGADHRDAAPGQGRAGGRAGIGQVFRKLGISEQTLTVHRGGTSAVG